MAATLLCSALVGSLSCASRTVVLDPAELYLDEWRTKRITVRGLTPSDFLEVRGSTLELVDDLSISLAREAESIATEIATAGVEGPAFTLKSEPRLGWYDVVVRARGRTYGATLLVRERGATSDADVVSDSSSDGDADADADAPADADVLVDADADGLDDADALVDGDAQADAEVEAACEAGEAACDGDDLQRCVDGAWVSAPCPLGCVAAEARCVELVPSNVVGPVAAGGALLEVWGDVVFDTETGRIGLTDGTEVRLPGEGILSDISFAREDPGCLGTGIFGLGGLWLHEGATLSAQSSRALVLLVDGEVILDGFAVLSATAREPGSGGYRGGERGEAGYGPGGGQPGTYFTDCCDSGGGGGGHADVGGDGGGAWRAPGGSGGSAAGAPEIEPLCGGSGGGGELGPTDTWPTRGSEGGAGGGAIQISASTSIVVSSTGGILAGGGGGTGGHPAGGGGGGAGGAVLLEAPAVEVAGRLGAVGGGGGAGGHDPYGLPGDDGDDGGAGGASNPDGGDGGGGGGVTLAGQAGQDHSNNGGGGGGAAGRIRLNTRDGTAVVTGAALPAPSQGAVSTR